MRNVYIARYIGEVIVVTDSEVDIVMQWVKGNVACVFFLVVETPIVKGGFAWVSISVEFALEELHEDKVGENGIFGSRFVDFTHGRID